MAVRSSGARCAFLQSIYIPLLPERVASTASAYKHSAPLEQELELDIYYNAANNN